MRAKCRSLNEKDVSDDVNSLPEWNFDGSSCYQATTENSEIILKPVFMFPDPFRGGKNIMVLCETFRLFGTNYQNLIPSNTNFRYFAKKIFDKNLKEEPWYGIEQEYTLMDKEGKFVNRPLKWPHQGFPSK
jgi:glutamine synthetase